MTSLLIQNHGWKNIAYFISLQFDLNLIDNN